MNYFISWAHAYSVHFGVWVSFGLATTIYKKGLPDTKKLPGLLKTAVAIAAILSLFSSHSHVHFTNFLMK